MHFKEWYFRLKAALNVCCWREVKCNICTCNILTLTSKRTFFTAFSCFILLYQHASILFSSIFYTPEYIGLFYFYDSYFPQTLQSPCTSLSKLKCFVLLFPLCALVGSYPDQKKSCSFSPHFYWAISLYLYIAYNETLDHLLWLKT